METLKTPRNLHTPSSLHPVILYSETSLEAFLLHIEAFLGKNNGRSFWVCDADLLLAIKTHWPKLNDYLSTFPVFSRYSGEAIKTQQALFEFYDFLIEHGADRSSTLVALGGGAILDLTGFAAATFQRGIPYVNIPTTLLGMVDAGMGGKTGINIPQGKNLIGCNHIPQATLLWPNFLSSLPKREWNSGMAEVIKHALLDKDLFQTLCTCPILGPKDTQVNTLMEASCRYKLNLTAQDPLDTEGLRVFLNLGHTFAHAIESITQYQEYLHGEAVSIGLYLASLYSHRAYHIPSQIPEALKALLNQYALPTKLHASLPINALMDAMTRDKKNKNQAIHLVTLKGLGEPFFERSPRLDWIKELWESVGGV